MQALKALSNKVTMRPVFPDLILGIGLCLMICGSFFMDTQQQRLVMYISILPLLFFVTKAKGWFSFAKEKNTLFFGALAFLSFACLSLIWSQDIDAERIWQKLKVLPFLTLFLLGYAHYFKRYPRSWQYFIEAFIAVAAITAPIVLSMKLPNYYSYPETYNIWRIAGFGGADNANQAGLLYGSALLCLVFLNPQHTIFLKSRTLRLLCAAAIAAVFLLTFSRGAFLACSLTLCGVLFLKVLHDVKNLKLVGFALLACTAIVALLVTIYPEVPAYIFERGSTGRLQIWQSAWEQYKDSPLLGIGIGTKVYYSAFENISITASHAHSLYVATLLHLGAIGFIIFLSLCIHAALKAMLIGYKEHDYAPFILIAFGLGFGLVDFGGYYISLSNEWVVFWIPLAYLISRHSLEKPRSA